jgi:hypothetical protein
LGAFWEEVFFRRFWDRKKSAQNLEKSAGGAKHFFQAASGHHFWVGPAECAGLPERKAEAKDLSGLVSNLARNLKPRI